MSTPTSEFVWYELMTSDAPAAEAFYGAVAGWGIADAGMPGQRYTILSVGKTPVGGLMALPAEAQAAGLRPHWMGYVAVSDVDASAAHVLRLGGAVHRAAEDIPGVGRFAVVADPQGASFTLFKGLPMEQPPQPPSGTPGTIGWHELHATDWKSAWGFYAELLGWTQAEAVDMGPMGIYQVFVASSHPVGGMMDRGDGTPAASWLYYIHVEQIDAGAERVRAHGGQVLHGPHEVPGGSWIAQCQDPQGARFALLGPR